MRSVRRSRHNYRSPIPATGQTNAGRVAIVRPAVHAPPPVPWDAFRGNAIRRPLFHTGERAKVPGKPPHPPHGGKKGQARNAGPHIVRAQSTAGHLGRRRLAHTGLSGPPFTQQPIPSRFARGGGSLPPFPFLVGRALRSIGPDPGTPPAPVAGGLPPRRRSKPPDLPPLLMLGKSGRLGGFSNSGLATPADVAGPPWRAAMRQRPDADAPRLATGKHWRTPLTPTATPSSRSVARRTATRKRPDADASRCATKTTRRRQLFHPTSLGADSLRIYLTGAAADGAAQGSQTQSLGGWRSSVEATRIGWIYSRPLIGVAIVQASRHNLSEPSGVSRRTGRGNLIAASADELRYTAPGSTTIGDAVTIAAGETKTLTDGADPSKWIRVTRTGSADLAGLGVISFDEQLNNVFGLSNAANAESTAGGDRVRAVHLKNVSSDALQDLQVWVRPLGTAAASTGGGLPAAGAGTIASSADGFLDWPHQGWVRVETSGGTLREIAYYSARTDTTLTVPALGRGRLGTSAAAGATGDVLYPVAGVRIATETPAADGSVQFLASESTLPTGVSWATAVTAAAGIQAGTLGANKGLVLWIHRELPAGVSAWPEHHVELELSFTAGGSTFGEVLAGLFRIAVDAMDRYELYIGVNGEPASLGVYPPGPVPDETFASLPYVTSYTFASGNTYHLVTQRRNKYGMVTEILDTTQITITAGAVVTNPPSAPEIVSFAAAAGGTFGLRAVYFADADAAAVRADQWLIYLRTDGTDPVPGVDSPTVEDMVNKDGAPVLEYSTAAYAPGTLAKVLVRARRFADTSDSASSAIASATAASAGPAAAAGSLHWRDVAEQDQ